MEPVSSGSAAALDKLVQALPYDIYKLILDAILDPSLIGGRPLEADHLEITDGSDDFLAGNDAVDVADRRPRHSRRIKDMLLFRGSAPKDFSCNAWLSPGLKLGCTVRIYSQDGLIGFEKVLRQHTGMGSYVTILVIYADYLWHKNCSDHSEVLLRRILGMTLKKLPQLRALYLKGQAVDAVLGLGHLPLLLPELKILYLRDSYGRVPHLLNMPSRLTTLKLKGVKIQSSVDTLSAFPELPYLERLALRLQSLEYPPSIRSFAKSHHLRALSIDTLENEGLEVLVREVGSQILEVCVDAREREEEGLAKMPPWLFNYLTRLQRFVIYGHCTLEIIRSIPDTVQVLNWFIENDKYLKEAAQIFECLQDTVTMPNLQAIPYIGYREPYPYDDVIELEDVFDLEATIEAGQAALAYLRGERLLQELEAPACSTSYKSFWIVLKDWSELAIELPEGFAPFTFKF